MKKFKSIALASLLAVPALANADAYTGRVNVGAMAGIDSLSGGVASSSTNLGLGARLGYHLNETFELAGAFSTTGNTTTANSVTSKSRTSLIMAELSYHLPDEWNPLSFGARLGVGVTSAETAGVSTSAPAKLAWGLTGGYDYPLSQNVTLGPKISYTKIAVDNSPDQADLQIYGLIKYYF